MDFGDVSFLIAAFSSKREKGLEKKLLVSGKEKKVEGNCCFCRREDRERGIISVMPCMFDSLLEATGAAGAL